MSNPTAEFNHVSEFYETILGLSFFMMFAVLLLALFKGTLSAIVLQRDQEDEDYINWLEKGGKYAVPNPNESFGEIKH